MVFKHLTGVKCVKTPMEMSILFAEPEDFQKTRNAGVLRQGFTFKIPTRAFIEAKKTLCTSTPGRGRGTTGVHTYIYILYVDEKMRRRILFSSY